MVEKPPPGRGGSDYSGARVGGGGRPDGGGRGRGGGRRAGGGGETLPPPMREALRARCTVGEICGVLRELWGTFDAQRG